MLFFLLLELGLALAGVGTSYDYFYEVDIDGQTYYQENPDFADQFYPPSLGIGPTENTFSQERSPDLVRVYILGGSAAMGFPHKNHGLDRLFAAQLRAALPGREIEVINTAMTSINSHVVYAVAKSLPKNSADFAVVLMGNNEVVGPYGPGTFNQNFLSNISLIRSLQALKRTRLWQALDGVIGQARNTDAMEELEWEGMQMFTSHGVPHDDPRMESVYGHYEDNLTSIIETLQSKGMHVLLSSVPVNVRHSAPFLSVHSPDLSDEQLDQWRSLHDAGTGSASDEDWAAAVTSYQAALAIDPDYADTHFRLATALENLGKSDLAKTHYHRALDLDALRFRADSRINQIIKDTAAGLDADAFSFADNATKFEEASYPYQPGWNLLLEHVHYDFSGNYVLATELTRSIVASLAPSDTYSELTISEVAERTGFPNFDTAEEIRNLQGMIQQPPFPGQSNYAELQDFLNDKLDRITRQIGSTEDVVQRRQSAVDAGTVDWKVHFELAVLYQRLHNPPAMYFHLNRILELYPHNRESYMKLAEELSKDGRWAEVTPLLERSLDYTRGDRKKTVETIGWLGTVHLRMREYDKATDYLVRVTKEYPDQIGATLRAYGNLIKHSRDTRKTQDLERYVEDVQDYAETLIRQGKDEEFPLLYRRMSQIMTMGGYTAEAQEWAHEKEQ